ncbi:malonyl-CoA decarboxylase [Comamonas jiangduensis]|uniref:Malonyl-CoA decarboxylase n=1 Tax=Comamonas jiangduensis TaxID=1194168 RepID=A0ABV4IE11_9BURK
MKAAPDWLARSVDKLRGAAAQPVAAATQRPMAQRLKATLRRGPEALSPHVLRRLMDDLQAAASEQLSEVEAAKHAQSVMGWYASATDAQKADLWLLMCEEFGPDAQRIQAVRLQLEQARNPGEMTQAEIDLRKVLVSARTRLLQRFSVPEGGMRFLIDMRAELLKLPKSDKRFVALDAELEHLFANWFDVAFLELRKLTWDSPASLLEKLIQYEAVHDIRSWADLKNRVDSDRRCYGFFHPKMPNEPLIFVEVALVEQMSAAIAPLLDEHGARADLSKASTAIFYSISNTQNGLRGVSFGNSLIKRVVDDLLSEFPKLRSFATLSPIPGLRQWLLKHGDVVTAQWTPKQHTAVAQALGVTAPVQIAQLVQAGGDVQQWAETHVLRKALMACAAHYLAKGMDQGRPLDPVARFHLGNGARVERINWAADLSSKGLKQSLGLMVNYLYDLKRLDKHRDSLAQGKVPVSAEVDAWRKGW